MLTAAALALSTMSAPAQFHYLGYGNDDNRTLATQAPYVSEVAITGQWHKQIGREYHGLVWRKGEPVGLRDSGAPGPARYGASQDDYSRYYARVGNVVVSASPWIRTDDDSSVQRVERARQTWLREQGYTGGTRTFRNPRYATSTHVNAEQDIPGWTKIKIQVPKRPRFEVNAGEAVEREAPKVVVARGTGRVVVSHPSKNVTIISRAK